ncbi:KdsC family phosphatase [Tardiphaga sp. 862_B3_N1_1]|uniref:KdsC family phosphatase n=1 Tax=Tardiphaga sp. 862_B3_N1_1 TaxID=3240763 RepID=UPI003F8BF90A
MFDFDGVFTDNTVYVSQDGTESVRCWRSDGLGLSRVRSAGVKMLIISTETNPVVTARAAKLQLPCKQGIADKAEAVIKVCREFEIAPKCTMFVGNDINDIPAFKVVGLPVAVADAYPEVNQHVLWRTSRAGGFGAVREVCDAVFEAKRGVNGQWL